MNKLVIPSSPSWYEPSIVACAPDNTLFYGARNALVVIKPNSFDKPAIIKTIPHAHYDKITGVVLNHNWGTPSKLAITTGDDKIVKLWNCDTYETKASHNGHSISDKKLIGATFAGDDRVISVSEDGLIVLWRVSNDEKTQIKHLLGLKVKVTCISSCPHANWLTAFGLASGLVIVADMRKNGSVIYKLRAHDKNVLTLAWCPAPINVFPVKKPLTNKIVIEKSGENTNILEDSNVNVIKLSQNDKSIDKIDKNILEDSNVNIIKLSQNDESIDKIEESIDEKCVIKVETDEEIMTEEKKLEAPKTPGNKVTKKVNPWMNLVHADDDEIKEDDALPKPEMNDFLTECMSLKNKISETILPEETEEICTTPNTKDGRQILKPKSGKNKSKSKKDLNKSIKLDANVCDEKSFGIAMNNLVANIDQVLHTLGDGELSLESTKIVPKFESIILDTKMEDVAIAPHIEVICINDPQIINDPTIQVINEPQVVNEPRIEVINEPTILVINDPQVVNKPTIEVINDPQVVNMPTIEVINEPTIQFINDPQVINKPRIEVINEPIIQVVNEPTIEVINEPTIQVKNDLQVVNVPTIEIINEPTIQVINDPQVVNKPTIEVINEPTIQIINDPQIVNEPTIEVINDPQIEEVEKPRKEYLLASSARGGSICIWRAGSDGRMQVELRLGGNKNRNRNYNNKDDKSWISLCWITPSLLLSSSPRGELLKWDLSVSKGYPQSKLIHNDHGSLLFSIVAPIKLTHSLEADAGNWRERAEGALAAWSMGQDRMLLYTTLDAQRNTLVCYPTIGGSINCFATSPVDPNRVAIGLGDGTARVWDLSRPHLQYISMSNIWQKMSGKVLTLAWHPTKENLLAYGTIDGRVGMIHTSNLSKTPTLLTQYFRTPIHRLEWGPLNGNVDDLGLYVCCEGALAFYDTSKPLDAPKLMETRKDVCTQMVWKPDYGLLVVGTKNGCIDVYSKDLKLVKTFYWQKKAIGTLAWHPQATAEDEEASPYENWLASTSTCDHTIIIYNLANIEQSLNEASEDLSKYIVAELNGHTKPVYNISWSTYEGGKMVSVSEDGCAQVWNVKDKTNIATFVNHNVEPISSGLWSPLDKNLIIIGNRESGIIIWDINEHPPKSEAEIAEERKKRTKFTQNAKRELKTNNTPELVEEKEKKLAKDMLNIVSKYQLETKDLLNDCRQLLALKENEMEENEQLDVENEEIKESDAPAIISLECTRNSVMELFGNQKDLLNLLDKQQKQHRYKNKPNCVQQISLWKGDLGETIKEAIIKGQLTPWLINMAPMVSHKLWQEACESYASKLSETPKSDPLEIASYYLTCHNVIKAIDVLCTGGLYREALAVAKCRLPTNEALINEITDQWASYSLVNGRFEVAAQCFIVLGKFEDAAKVLFKRSDVDTLELAAELAKKCDNSELYKAITFRCIQFKQAIQSNDTIEETDTIKETDTIEVAEEATVLCSRLEAIILKDNNKIEEANKENICAEIH